MNKWHILSGIAVGIQPGLAAGIMMAVWGVVDWPALLFFAALGIPLGILTARNGAFREKHPDFERRDIERRMRGW